MLPGRRWLAALLAVAWLVLGGAGAYAYVHRYALYRGFPTPRTPAGIPRGTVRDVRFWSPAVHRTSRYLVYLPPGYAAAAAGGRRFPVLYLLHGYPGKARVFLDVDAVHVDADVLIARGRMPPALLVMPAGAEGVLHGDSEWANTPSGRWMDFVLDVVRDVDHRFATRADRQHRGIAGASEGAYGALNIALRHLDLFSVIQSWGGYFWQQRTGPFRGASPDQLRANSPGAYVGALAPEIRRRGLRAWLLQGRSDRADPRLLVSFGAKLRRAGAEVREGFFAGGHDWGLFRRQTPRMLVAAGRWFRQRPSGRPATRLRLGRRPSRPSRTSP